MRLRALGIWMAAACALVLAPVPASGQLLNDNDLVAALRAGGHVIVFRHGATNPDQADTDPLNSADTTKQRHLSEQGKQAARALGKALKQIGVPVSQTWTSAFHRAYETAVLAELPNIQKTIDLTEGGLVVSPNENARRTKALRKLAATAPAPGTNVVVVSHKPNIVEAFGKDWFDIREGEAAVFRPEGDTAKLVARVDMTDWSHISMMARAADSAKK